MAESSGDPLVKWMVEISAVGAEAVKQATAGVRATVEAAQLQITAMQKSAEGVAASMKLAMDKATDPKVRQELVGIAKAFGQDQIAAEVAQRAIANVMKESALAVAAAADEAAKAQQAAAQKITDLHKQQESAVKAVTLAFAGYTASILGTVRAGMAGTMEAVRFHIAMERLSREISGIFKPAIDAVIDKVNVLVNWFRNLTGDQQKLIANLTGASLGLMAMAAIMPRVAASIGLVKAALTALSAHPIIAIVSAVGALLVGTESGRAAIGKLFTALSPLVDAIGEIVTALSPLFEALGQIVSALVDIVSPIIRLFSEIIKTVATGLTQILNLFGMAQKTTSAAGHTSLSPAGGGFESLESTWSRLQGNINATDTQREMLTHLENIDKNTQQTAAHTEPRGAGAPPPEPAPGGFARGSDMVQGPYGPHRKTGIIGNILRTVHPGYGILESGLDMLHARG